MRQLKNSSKWFMGAIILLFLSSSLLAQNKTSSSAFEISVDGLKEFVGDYKTNDSNYFNITISMNGDEKLMAQPTDKSEPNTLLVATKKDYFNLANTPLKIHFNRNEDGEIESLTFSQGSESFTASRAK